MPLNNVDLDRRRASVGLPTDLVGFILYSYDEYTFEEKSFKSVYELLDLLNNKIDDNKSYWIEVINGSSVDLPDNIRLLCEYLNIHPLTIEDISTLAPNMKLDLFDDQGVIYLLMKIITWNGTRVEQQQISFYLKCSQNLLITFQDKAAGEESPFVDIRNRLRGQRQNNGQSSPCHLHSRLQQLDVDYLFYCLLDAIIDKYMFVLEEIALSIDRFDVELMRSKQSPLISTLHSIYRLKHDLLHLRILCNPLKEIVYHLQRTTHGDRLLLYRRTGPSLRLGIKHRIVRRPPKLNHELPISSDSLLNIPHKQKTKSSIFSNTKILIYLNDLNTHVDHLIDSLELQRESVSILISFWVTLNSNETEEILKFLMLITVLFMPCILLTGINSTNFYNQIQYPYENGYYILLALLATTIISMLTWYKLKRLI